MQDCGAMLEPRPARSSPWFLGVLLAAILWWCLDLVVLRAGVPHPLDDTWEDAIVARLVIEGHGLRTHMIYPPLWELRDPVTLTLPVLVHGPLLPLLLALPLKLAGPAALDAIAWLGALFATLTLIPLYRLASRRFGEPIAAGACLLFTFSPLSVDAVNHYVSVLLGALLLTWALDLLARDRPRAVAAGIVAGVCSLTRPETMVAVPVLVWLAWAESRAAHRGPAAAAGARPRGGTAAALRFAVAFAIVASWWSWERWRAVGSPFFNLSSYLLACFSPAHPGDALVRDFAVTPQRYPAVLAESLPTLWRKWAHTFPRALRRALESPADSLGWLAPIGFLVAWVRGERRRTLLAFLLLALIPVASVTLIAPVRLYPVPFLPLYCIAAMLGLRWIVTRLPSWAHRPRAWLLLGLLLALPAGAIEMKEQAAQARALEVWLARDRVALAAARRAPGDAPRLMFSDTPDFVAWTTGRPTVWLTREEFDSLFGSGHVPPLGIPRRPDPADTWFHRGDPRDARDQAGSRWAP